MKLEDYYNMIQCINDQLLVLNEKHEEAIEYCDLSYRNYFKNVGTDQRKQADALLKSIREKEDILYELKRRVSYEIGKLEGK